MMGDKVAIKKRKEAKKAKATRQPVVEPVMPPSKTTTQKKKR
jgi:hypothetical protein